MADCNHIIGFASGFGYDAWLVYLNDSDSSKTFMDEKFKYCPKCGKKLEEEDA